jgi:hypothetical protein
MEDVVVFLVPLGFFAMIAYIAKVIGDTRIRRKVLDTRAEAEVAKALLNRGWSEPSTRSALKWGIVIVALGAGILLVDLFGIGFESPVAYAILLLATGAALLGYYLIERDNVEDDRSAFAEQAAPSPSAERTSSEDIRDPEL